MAKFRLGGSGPDGMGLGWIRGITGRRFNRSGEIYETGALDEIQALRRCQYVEEIVDEAANLGSPSARKKKDQKQGRHSSPDAPGIEKTGISTLGSPSTRKKKEDTIPSGEDERVFSREALRHKKMRELIKIGRGLYRVGMTKEELIERISIRD